MGAVQKLFPEPQHPAEHPPVEGRAVPGGLPARTIREGAGYKQVYAYSKKCVNDKVISPKIFIMYSKRFFPFVVILYSAFCFAQTSQNYQQDKIDSILTRIDSILQMNNLWLQHIETNQSFKQRYKLYQTDNMYTFLQLDTKTGMIEQIQWSLDSAEEGSMTINDVDLSRNSFRYESGSFELYPTQNIYQFILLDKEDGRKWHVQWGFKSEKRWIRRIY